MLRSRKNPPRWKKRWGNGKSKMWVTNHNAHESARLKQRKDTRSTFLVLVCLVPAEEASAIAAAAASAAIAASAVASAAAVVPTYECSR